MTAVKQPETVKPKPDLEWRSSIPFSELVLRLLERVINKKRRN